MFKWEVELGAKYRANMPCLMHGTCLCQMDIILTYNKQQKVTLTCSSFPVTESWAISALVIIGRMIIGIGFGVAYVYSTEVFPTILRSNGMSAGSVCARIGGMLAPFIGNLVRKGVHHME